MMRLVLCGLNRWRLSPRCVAPQRVGRLHGAGVWLPMLAVALTGWLRGDEPGDAFARVEVAPTQAVLRGNLDRLQILLTGYDAQQRPADLTRDARYRSLDPDIVRVTPDGLVQGVGNGAGRIEVVYGPHRHEVGIEVLDVSAAPQASFGRDVMPILSRAGCTGGACHAAQYGQGGFKLSLFGFAPEQDYDPIVRDRMQRRVSLQEPEQSLLLRKATMQVSHGGGQRFDVDSYDYQVLRDWIAAGAPRLQPKEPKVVDLHVWPAQRVYRPGEYQQLRVVAVYSDGTQRDVTLSARYDSMSDAVVSATPRGLLRATGAGQTPVMVRYEGQAKISMAVVPYEEGVDLSGFRPRNFIDELVAQRWQLLGLQPAQPCSDAEFLRRAFLDAIGTLPPPAKVEAFLASTDPDKREHLVDELLGLTGDPQRDVYVNEWSAYWALKWGDLLRNNRNTVGDGGMWAFANWIRAALRQNMPVDQFVREIITAQGSVFESGPANYYKIATRPDDLAEATVQNFLGVRLQCAKCHHHPFEVYSQEDYYGLAAFFTRVGNKNSSDFGALGGDSVVLVRSSGSIRHPRTGQVMQPAVLGGQPLAADEHRDLRKPLADWLTSPDNRLFAYNIANRFWGYLMGVGLVEPIDDLRATNPPSNPALLDALADHLVRSNYDLRKLMRAIMTSQVYQLSARAASAHDAQGRFYTQYNVKRLPAEVLLDAVDFACGTREKFAGIPAGTRAIELPDPNFVSYFLDTLGRPQRVIACECERTAEPNLAQVLHLVNGDVLQRKISDRNGRIAQLLAAKKSDEEIIAELYLVTFSRPPEKDEIAACLQVIAAAGDRRQGLEDILWALCNSREFLFNH
jgi:hypothetical protein